MNRRQAIQFAAAAVSGAATSFARTADRYPSKPVHLVVSSASGTPPDLVGRLVAERLQLAFSQPVIVENRPGAIGTIGLRSIARAEPDGHVIGMFSTPYLVAPSLLANMPLDIERDLTPVAIVATTYALLVVPANSPARSVPDLMARAKAKPGSLVYASGGNGTPSHIGSALLLRAAGVEAVHVPYQGASTVVAVVSGDAGMYLGPVATLAALIEAGKLRVLATAAPRRVAAYPDVPTLVELGYAGVELTDWLGVVAPSATPAEIVVRLATEIAAAGRDGSVRDRLASLGVLPTAMDHTALVAFFHGEYLRWNRLVREAGIKAG